MRVTVVGGGRLGRRVARGLRDCWRGEVVVTVRGDAERTAELLRGVRIETSNVRAIEGSEAVILAIKGRDVPVFASEVRGLDLTEKRLVSFAVGVSMRELRSLLNPGVTCRAMGNLSVALGLSPLAYVCEPRADEIVLSLLRCLGEPFEVDENVIPAWTALFGSGLAVAIELFESFILAGLKMGLELEELEKGVPLLFEGAARLVREEGNIRRTKLDVVTPGGVTIEALLELEKERVKWGIASSLVRAWEKALAAEGKYAGGKI